MGKKTTKHINDIMNNDVAQQINSPTIDEAKELLEIGRNQIFIADDASIANPNSLLGRVLEKSNIDGNFKRDFHMHSVETEVDEQSKLRQPLKTKSFVVDKKLSLEIGFLNFLSLKLDAESLFSVVVLNQAVGLVDDKHENYKSSIEEWIESSKVYEGYNENSHFIVTGFVQKNIIRKKYKKFDVKYKGGAFGINFNGNLYTSTEDYSLDIRFGLSVRKINKLKNVTKNLSSDFTNFELEEYVADKEININFNV